MESNMFQIFMKLYIKDYISSLESISGNKGINNLRKSADSNLNALLNQIRKLIGLREEHDEKDTSIDFIKEHIKLLLGEANALDTELVNITQDMIALTELKQKASSGIAGSKFMVDETDMQMLKSMIQWAGEESPNLSFLMKHFAKIITILKSFFKNKDSLMKGIHQENKDSDINQVPKRVSRKSYSYQENEGSVATDTVTDMAFKVKDLRASQNLKEMTQNGAAEDKFIQLQKEIQELKEII